MLECRVVTDQAAVFSVRPGCDQFRLGPLTPFPGLFLAGDWTATGWPATMEGAVRSGYRAATELLKSWGLPAPATADELPTGWLARIFLPSNGASRLPG